MGLLISTVTFDGDLPTIDDVCAGITDLTGLKTIVVQLLADDPSKLDAEIAFECATENYIEIDVAKKSSWCDGSTSLESGASCEHSPVDQESSKLTVRVTAHIGQDETLTTAAKLALEKLGGQLDYPLDEDVRREFETTIDESKFLSRLRKRGIKNTLVSLLLLPLLIVWIPFIIAASILMMVGAIIAIAGDWIGVTRLWRRPRAN